jgi:NAD/NADP transhydrogenase beta subunit
MFAAGGHGSRADKRGVSPVPVLAALLTAVAGASSATVGLVLGSTAMMFAGMVLGGMGSVLIQLIGKATSRRRQGCVTRKVHSASHFIH